MTTAVNSVVDRIAADVRQLVEPIHVAVRGRVVTHLPLLDQLRLAAVPAGGRGGGEGRRTPPGSRPPANLSAVEAHANIYVAVSEWRVRLDLPSPLKQSDWQKAMLRMIASRASVLDLPVAEWLAVEAHEWWRDAAVGAGWNPADLLKLR
jgi:hypothetical protein